MKGPEARGSPVTEPVVDKGEEEKPQFEIGKTYMCGRHTGSTKVFHPATLVKQKSTRTGIEFYVHYLELDRRLDEWVSMDRLGDEIFIAVRSDRRRRDRLSVTSHAGDDEDPSNLKRHRSEHAHFHEKTKVRNINRVQLGKHEIDCWYYSPYPKAYGNCDKLYICETTLKYFGTKRAFVEYQKLMQDGKQSPPGKQIYYEKDRSIRVFEIDGSEEKLFGQNLCLFGKLFIEHKTLSFDASPFFFYVLYEEDSQGLHPVGYFSKEKESKENYNLACIVTLPPYQRKGYGKFIISLSYEITKFHKEIGSPEKPLSDLGKLSYRSYWSFVLLRLLVSMTEEELSQVSLEAMSIQTGIKPEDILSTMESLKMIHHLKSQFVIRISREHLLDLLLPLQQRNFDRAFCKRELLTL
uniref:histone acetyltransferase n=1 Tax=Mucochytrium quahogii TaxID=96639 RepID=A0A7S2SDC7_9STRA